MQKLNLIFIGICMLLLSACKDDNAGPTSYTIAGHLYEDCSMQPKSNFKLLLYQEVSYNPFTGITTGGELATATTDENGYFKFEFKDLKGSENSIKYAAGAGYNSAMIEIPTKTSLENLVVYINPTINLQVTMNVVNPHTSMDTLNIAGKLISGPFSSGIVYSEPNLSLPVMSYIGKESEIIWYFIPYSGTHFSQPYVINKYCNDTIFVTATIN